MEPQTITLPKTFLYRLELVLYATTFAIPFFIPGPQWFTGSVVNFVLLMYVTNFPRKNSLAIAILPSIAAFAHGVLFGPFTPFLFYFLPLIWLGNITLMQLFAYFQKHLPRPLALLLSASAKTIILFFAASLYFRFHIVPVIFITSMGAMQLYTALVGGIFALLINQLLKKKYE